MRKKKSPGFAFCFNQGIVEKNRYALNWQICVRLHELQKPTEGKCPKHHHRGNHQFLKAEDQRGKETCPRSHSKAKRPRTETLLLLLAQLYLLNPREMVCGYSLRYSGLRQQNHGCDCEARPLWKGEIGGRETSGNKEALAAFSTHFCWVITTERGTSVVQ